MKFIVEPSSNGWVAVNPGLREEDLVGRLSNADILVSDLDDTDAPSPAKGIAFRHLKMPRYWLNSLFLHWCLITPYKLAKNGKHAESETWSDFVEKFLRNNEELQQLNRAYTTEFAASTFYEGALDFYALFPKTLKIYITRNVKEIAEAYRQAAGLDEAVSEQFDKTYTIEKILTRYHLAKRFLVKGDSWEDEAMLDFLISAKRKGGIEDVVSIYVADSPSHINPKFDINIGRNYKGLVRLVTEASLPLSRYA